MSCFCGRRVKYTLQYKVLLYKLYGISNVMVLTKDYQERTVKLTL